VNDGALGTTANAAFLSAVYAQAVKCVAASRIGLGHSQAIKGAAVEVSGPPHLGVGPPHLRARSAQPAQAWT
jgi:hypothetical protein